ncbi:alpha-N-acetylglucosaminidase [Segatella copri]|uniref:alpha-N-acetylglucosaminidase n=1 Tax=Segatella copri TaxID=165179 RepID=UPI001C4605A9|nr:alpha-N-acetylglucosaminidase [Segatella copri]WOZ85989.1 alpha-N-acetylglucosaminidase [Segatella copri]
MRKVLVGLLCTVALGAFANPADDLLNRIDKGAAAKFKTVLVKSDKDFFEIDQAKTRKGNSTSAASKSAAGKNNPIIIRGNSWVNIAVGINWYLKHHAGIHISWNNMNVKLPAVLPVVKQKERHETDLKLRYNFNYCTFSYTMAFWNWNRWQKEIDWMALHGINMPLAAVGTESVWRNMLLKLGYSEEEVGKFIAGPAFLAWWEMNNLEGWGGPLPLNWYKQQEALQKKILARMKEMGMKPVLPGYCGMVPHDAKQKLGLNVTDAGRWNSYQRPANLSPTDSRFAEIADLYYKELTRLYGKSDYYSMDPFHESGNDAAVDYGKAGEALMSAMKRANPHAIWVVQGWNENPRPQMIANLKVGDLLVLDLFSESRQNFKDFCTGENTSGTGKKDFSTSKKEGIYGKHQWLFCLLENFGGNVGLHGRMDQLLNNFYLATGKKDTPKQENSSLLTLHSSLKGWGFTMEGSENNPVMFELMSELPWRAEKITKEDWIREYCYARYGVHDATIEKAWILLAQSIYNCPKGNIQQGTHESIFCARPSLNSYQVSTWSLMSNYYDPEDTRQAAILLTSVAEKYRGNNNFEYDLVDICRQALADQGRKQYLKTMADYKSFSRQEFKKDSDRFLKMILLQDKLLGTRQEFRLGHWIEEARNLGKTAEEKDLYEWNARVQITTWGNRICADNGGLHDYGHKEWQGLLKDFYYLRWSTFMKSLASQLSLQNTPRIDWYGLEEPWTLQKSPYSSKAEGSPIDVAKEVIDCI